ncbi:FAD-containing monooxygenase EthA [Golovinomyces cichoracearum]|uniref:FAD-containing monooxygenase EthA n=1 Tax=Golovinomyces cichoracearum TaxID=62708 RepID=A0A420I7H9_9PEZI|nr:FAD-containing monooxygenase EthA [Golovinomyces cichoracearum]
MSSPEPQCHSFDVLIVGAGISGINAAYRLQSQIPECSYTIIEARDAMGGTWDLFRYPGIRSDSDLHTFGFVWRPWISENPIADGESIRNYLHKCAEEEGIDKKIRYRHKLLSGNWSTAEQKWTFIVDADGQEAIFRVNFVVLCTGYYNYKEPLKSEIPGLTNFKGNVIHPQFWPEDLDYTDKKVVIIGSGATAVTIFPVVAKKAAHVTMLQRSPSYILATPAVDKSARFLRRFLPVTFVARIMRLKFLILPFLFFNFCRTFPGLARSLLRANSKAYLPKTFSPDLHFKPKYNPWDQRLCVSPDGDFYTALHHSNAEIVTDTIETVTEDSIRTTGGTILKPDIIITATGLRLQVAGGATMTIDNKPIDIPSKFFWRGAMVQDIPNATFIIGYTNASWTLGADSTTFLFCRLLKYMRTHNISSVIPHLSESDLKSIQCQPSLDLKSTYIKVASNILPKSGDKSPWQSKRNYIKDSWGARYSDLKNGLLFIKSKNDENVKDTKTKIL